jgi:hypothetical protein
MRTLLIAAALAAAPVAAQATVLTFDVAGGVSDHANLAGTYGDRVSVSPDGLGHGYGFGPEGATPNVVLDYGAAGEDIALWTTSYGDLVNVAINDADSDTTFTVTLTADTGYLVDFYGFDLASFVSAGQTLAGFAVRDGDANLLARQGSVAISGATHNSFDYATPLSANRIQLVLNLSGLGGASDDIGLDNLRFGQHAAVASVPEPASWALMILGSGAAGTVLRRRRRAFV